MQAYGPRQPRDRMWPHVRLSCRVELYVTRSQHYITSSTLLFLLLWFLRRLLASDRGHPAPRCAVVCGDPTAASLRGLCAVAVACALPLEGAARWPLPWGRINFTCALGSGGMPAVSVRQVAPILPQSMD